MAELTIGQIDFNRINGLIEAADRIHVSLRTLNMISNRTGRTWFIPVHQALVAFLPDFQRRVKIQDGLIHGDHIIIFINHISS